MLPGSVFVSFFFFLNELIIYTGVSSVNLDRWRESATVSSKRPMRLSFASRRAAAVLAPTVIIHVQLAAALIFLAAENIFKRACRRTLICMDRAKNGC